jgi:hypothetical protein
VTEENMKLTMVQRWVADFKYHPEDIVAATILDEVQRRLILHRDKRDELYLQDLDVAWRLACHFTAERRRTAGM